MEENNGKYVENMERLPGSHSVKTKTKRFNKNWAPHYLKFIYSEIHGNMQ